MHSQSVAPWTHGHAFLGMHHGEHERRTWSVVALTAAMMAAEIVGGTLFGSIALVADGWHMATHVAALAIAGLAYLFARRHLHDARFSLGTGKFGDMAAFASAIILGVIALGIGYESVLRLINPVSIRFPEALPIAALGLCVNLASAWLLREDHGRGHFGRRPEQHAHEQHAHEHHVHEQHVHEQPDHEHHGSEGRASGGVAHDAHAHDTNFRAAYVHVLADALTSVLTLAGLSAAWAFGWTFMDPAVGIVGMIVIVSWSVTLIRSAGRVLLDTVPDPGLVQTIRRRIEIAGDRVTDLHVWQVGPGHAAVVASIISDAPQAPAVYKQRLAGLAGLSHVTIEVNACPH